MTFTSGPTSELRSCALKSCLFELSPRSNGKIMKLAGKNTVGTVVLAVLKTLVTFNALRDQMSWVFSTKAGKHLTTGGLVVQWWWWWWCGGSGEGRGSCKCRRKKEKEWERFKAQRRHFLMSDEKKWSVFTSDHAPFGAKPVSKRGTRRLGLRKDYELAVKLRWWENNGSCTSRLKRWRRRTRQAIFN